MPVLDIAVKPFYTLLSIPSLLSGSHTMLLNAFGTETIGSLLDDTGLLEVGDPGSPTFDGDPLTYVGSGTAQSGVKVLGITVPLGAAKDIVVFEVNGQYMVHFPDGEPNLLGAIAMVVDINPVSYQVFTPVCFVSGTHLLTQSGKTPVENIRIGDALMTCDHGPQSVRWIGKSMMRFGPDTHKHKPILFQAGCLGDGLPERDLRVSPQHRIVLSGDAGAQAFGQDDVLAPGQGFGWTAACASDAGMSLRNLLFDPARPS